MTLSEILWYKFELNHKFFRIDDDKQLDRVLTLIASSLHQLKRHHQSNEGYESDNQEYSRTGEETKKRRPEGTVLESKKRSKEEYNDNEDEGDESIEVLIQREKDYFKMVSQMKKEWKAASKFYTAYKDYLLQMVGKNIKRCCLNRLTNNLRTS